MGKKNNEFQERLLETFRVEAAEHVKAISSGLLRLEKEPAPEKQGEIVEAVFREAHSLKGAARAVNLVEIGTLCQALESVFSALKQKEMEVSKGLCDLLHEAVDSIGQLLASGRREGQAEVAELVQRLESARQGGAPAVKKRKRQEPRRKGPAEAALAGMPPPAEERPSLVETVRISTSKLDSALRQAEELLSAKLAASHRAAELQETAAALAVWEKRWSYLEGDLGALQRSLRDNGAQKEKGEKSQPLARFSEFLQWNDTYLKTLERRMNTLAKSAEQDHRALGGMVDGLLAEMKKLVMLPFSVLLEIFPKFVRDFSREQGKEAELVIQGGAIEIDRRVLEEMKDPLIHLVRNCIDHGVEKPDERAQQKKPPQGTVSLAIAQRGGDKVEIRISDDGRGIDREKIRAAITKLGMVTAEEAERLDDPRLLAFVFESGVSTTPIITDISGRGLGLAIVREKVDRLGGRVSLESRPDAGTTVSVVLPLTVAAFRGILVGIGDGLFVFPTSHVERVLRVAAEEIKTVENRETIQVKGETVSLVRLATTLKLGRQAAPNGGGGKLPVVVLGSAGKRMAFLVDAVLSEQEVLVKSLGRQMARVQKIAGVAVLGTGKVVPILDAPELLRAAVEAPAGPAVPVGTPAEAKAKQQSILVVEDSITARTLLKNILEAAGYSVKTAVDGVDAFTTLKTEEFDLVVSDVDMPRMNGFDLTARIRSDKTLAELPVVLVTALESREDRERGIDVGANAYLVKSSFDQSNLLEVVRRLI